MPKAKKPTVAKPLAANENPNDKYLVLDFERDYAEEGETPRKYRYKVFLLPPNTFFEWFGGSRSGLVTGKTPSLIVREVGPWGHTDTEYDLAAKGVWQFLIAEGLTNFSVLHGNGAQRMADGMYKADGTV